MELTLFTPVLILILLFVLACGRLADSQLRLSDATHSAARAASLARDPSSATRAATAAAQSSLPAGGSTCASLDVNVDTTRFRPGGTVTVTLSCHVALADLGPLRTAIGSGTQTRSFTSPIDVFRSTTAGA